MTPDTIVAPTREGTLGDDVRLATSNAGKLGVSLIATWLIAVAVRIYMPRHLGPAAFGSYTFAEGLAVNAMGILSLGVDAYTLREVPLRPRHASEYFWGVTLLRLALAAVILGGLVAFLAVGGQRPETWRLTTVFGGSYFVASIGASLAACLQANATVGRVAFANVMTKAVWGALVGAALVLGAPLEAVAGAMLVAEVLRTALLYRETGRQMGMTFRLDIAATKMVLIASLPFYANGLVRSFNRLDLAILGFLAGEKEVGWYGAATMFYMLVLLLSPLMASVLLPLLSRVRARSEEELWRVTSRAAESLIAVSVPLALFLALGADLWVRILFGEAYAPAALSLRATAPLAVLTYIASLLSMTLFTVGKHWTVTISSAVGTVVSPLVAAALIPVGSRFLGAGGAGAAAALGAVAMETSIILIQLRAVGLQALGDRTLTLIWRSLLVSALVTGAHVLLAPLGHWRLAIDGALYVGLGLIARILPMQEMLLLVREVQDARRGARL